MEFVVTKILPVANYHLCVTFLKHGTRVFDVTPYLDKGIFKELKNEQYFKKVKVIHGGVEWPHEQDLSAETLFYRSKAVKPEVKKNLFSGRAPNPKKRHLKRRRPSKASRIPV